MTGIDTNVTRSSGVTSKRTLARSRLTAIAKAIPIGNASASCLRPDPSTSQTTSRVAAPSAIRMPISCVRWLVA